MCKLLLIETRFDSKFLASACRSLFSLLFFTGYFRVFIARRVWTWKKKKDRSCRADLRNSSAASRARPVLRVSNENMSLPVGGSRNPDAVAFSSACENFVICLNTLNYACAICWRLSTAFRGRETEEDASLGAEKGTIRGGSRKDGWRGDREKERGVLIVPHREECASRKGAAFLSNVIETTIKYERATMNAPNNSEFFAQLYTSAWKRRDPASILPFEGCEDMIKLRDTSCSPHVQVYVLARSTILRSDRLADLGYN